MMFPDERRPVIGNDPCEIAPSAPTARLRVPDDVMQRLVEAARAARERAYAPYSRFAVGAAVLDEHGHIHAGCNVENAAYPQGLCAEAGALAHLVLAGGRRVLAAAVVGDASSPVTPCGGCRQRLREFAADDAPVWVADLSSVRARFKLGELLPSSFGPLHLPTHAASDASPMPSSAALPASPAAALPGATSSPMTPPARPTPSSGPAPHEP